MSRPIEETRKISRPIEEAWVSYRLMVVPRDAGETQIVETRQAFFAGAAVLFTKLVSQLSEEKEESEDDLDFMSDVHREVTEFGQEIDQRVLGFTVRRQPDGKEEGK